MISDARAHKNKNQLRLGSSKAINVVQAPNMIAKILDFQTVLLTKKRRARDQAAFRLAGETVAVTSCSNPLAFGAGGGLKTVAGKSRLRFRRIDTDKL